MSDIIAQLLTYALAAWRRRGIAVAIAWLVALAGWTVVALMPDTFRSQATVNLNTASILEPLLGRLTVELDRESEIALMQKTLVTRANIEKVLRDTDLDLSAKTISDTERQIQDMTRRIQLKRRGGGLGRGPDLFVIGFEDADPQLAHDVVQSFLSIFVENSLGRNRGDMDSARRFIEDQIAVYEAKLSVAEQRIADFYKRNLGNLPTPGDDSQSLAAIRGRLSTLESDLSAARQQRQTLSVELKAIPQYLASNSSTGSGPPTDSAIQILEAQKLLDTLLARYTNKHPDVVVARRRLDNLFSQQEEEIGGPTDSKGPGGFVLEEGSGASNPVYEEIKVLVVKQEAVIATLQNRVAETRTELKEARATAARGPELQAELGRLNLDYEVLSTSYNQLLSSRQTEQISRAREEQTQPILFRVVEPPIVPTIPSGPNRALFLAAVLIVSLGSGLGFVVLLALSSETFSTIAELRTVLGIPVLGSISTATIGGRRALVRGQSVVFWTVTFALFGIFAALWFIEARIGLNEMVSGGILAHLPSDLLQRLPAF